MAFLKFVLSQKIFFNLLFLVLLIAGTVAFWAIPVDVYPDVPFNEATMNTLWPGATAQEVELLVTQKIEDEIISVPDIVKVRSQSARDRSSINVKFDENLSSQEFQNRLQDLRAAVNRFNDLPGEAEQTVVQALTTWEVFPLCQVVVSGGERGRSFSPEQEFRARQAAKRLRSVLLELEGVQKINDSFRDPEIHVEIRMEDLWQLGYTLSDVADKLRLLNRDFSAGQLNLSSAQFVLNTKGGMDDPKQLEKLVLFERQGKGPIRIEDVGRVSLGFEEAVVAARFNSKPCLTLSVVKNGKADSVQLVKEIHKAVELFETEQSLPEDVELAVVNDSSQIIRSRLSILTKNLLTGIVLVGLLLWLTVGARNALLALMGIPFSVLCAFLFFEPMGLTLNAISLFSLVLVSGMVVDDAIVILESIYQKVEEGLPIRDAVATGTWEVMLPVVSSTLTTVTAFLPMLLTEGIVGQYFAVVPKTVVVTLLASLVEAFFILPVHYLEWGPRRASTQDSRSERMMHWMGLRFASWTAGWIARPWRMIAFGAAMVLIAVTSATRIPVELFPSDFQLYTIIARLPEGSTLEQTQQAAVFIEDHIRTQVESGEVQYFLSTVGQAWNADNILEISPDLAQIIIFMHEDEKFAERPLNRTRQLLEAAFTKTEAPALRRPVQVEIPQDGPPTGKPVQLRLQHSDYDQLEVLGDRTMEYLRSIPGVHSTTTDLGRGPLRVDLKLRPEASALEGIDETQVGQIFQAANFGLRVGEFKDPRFGEAFDLKVMLTDEDRRGLQHLTLAPLRHPRTGALLPLNQVAYLESRSNFKAHPHYGGRRSVTITADVTEGVTTSLAVNAQLREWLQGSGVAAVVDDYRLGGEYEETAKSFRSMGYAFGIAALLIYMILATQFHSYKQPLIIMLAIPFAFVGVSYGLLAIQLPFTMTSFVAVIGLSGVVVNDTIVLIATINRNARQRKMTVDAAIVDGVRSRFRPILMTSLTTILGLLPMAIGLGGFSKVWSPFAATMSFGLMSALLLIMLVVPSLIKLIGIEGASDGETGDP